MLVLKIKAGGSLTLYTEQGPVKIINNSKRTTSMGVKGPKDILVLRDKNEVKR